MEGVEFTVNRDGNGVVNGFTLLGVGRTEAECFCMSLIKAVYIKKATIEFNEGKIVFTHRGITREEANPEYDIFGIYEGGVFSHDISDEDAAALSALLNRKEPYTQANVRVRPEIAWGKGFTVYIKH